MKVLMLKSTNFDGFKEAGKEYEISEDVATRWERNKIAKKVEEEIPEEIPEEIEEATETIDYSKMTNKELYSLCVERDIEVEQKRNKEYYIEALEGAELPEE